jgi:asparagine synthase (glutamine-hydrolysing)
MCGLAAILDWQQGGWASKDEAQIAVHKALMVMRHRGIPGATVSIKTWGNTILGHIRLPIIDINPRSDQPMVREGTMGVFVGEIFNYKGLVGADAVSDTEVLIDFYNAWGVDSFHNFDGFWSAVLVNKAGPVVITDYLSQKPLYFHAKSLLVVSEPDGAVAALPGLPQNLDKVYRSNVLKWGYDPTGRTPYAELVQLPAGSTLSLDPGPKIAGYWDWRNVPQAPNLRGALIQATANRLVGDRPVSLLLSGGLDSTIVFRILTQELKRKDVVVLHTPNNEDHYYRIATDGVAYEGQQLSTYPLTLKQALYAHQVPVDLGSMIPQTQLAQGIRNAGFFVCMSGDGADELFGGYRRAKEYDSQHSDVFMELPYYHLPRLDRIMMRSTVELRSPYLAPQVLKYAMSLPWKARTEKQALKDSFVDLVPDEILNRAKWPLKSPEVIHGGVQWRETVFQTWENQYVS